MSERLQARGAENTAERNRPADRFRVDAEEYPIFRRQTSDSEIDSSNEKVTWNIDKTASTYVTQTADLISVIDGTAEYDGRESEREGVKADHVIYLDKSARPVNWLVNTFWNDFSEEKRPEHSFLNIDRLRWFREVGLDVDAGGYLKDATGMTSHRATYDDFIKEADKLPPETFARIRALYVPGGVETEDLDEIMKMPTSLDGKDLLIVDEVSTTGATLNIAKYLLKRAIPELKSVNGETFWISESKAMGNTGEMQQRSTPVWYDHRFTQGRGIGEINPAYYEKRYEEHPSPRTRAQKLGAIVLSEYVDLGEEKGGLSRELAKEIQTMHRDYQEGKILLNVVDHWGFDRMADTLEAQGVRLAPASDPSPDTYANMKKEIAERKAVDF